MINVIFDKEFIKINKKSYIKYYLDIILIKFLNVIQINNFIKIFNFFNLSNLYIKKLDIFFRNINFFKNINLNKFLLLINDMIFNIKKYLNNNFYQIFYKYNYKDQKLIFDLYNYIYKISDKNYYLNISYLVKVKLYKNLLGNWYYNEYSSVKILNYKKIIKFNPLIFFNYYFLKYKSKKRYFIFLRKKIKNKLSIKQFNLLNFNFFNIKSKIKFKLKKHLGFKFKTFTNSILSVNKNKLANLFLLTDKIELVNVLNLKPKCFFNLCLNKIFI